MAKDVSKGKPGIGPLYTQTTTPRPDGELPGALQMFGALSVTSQFKVSLHLPFVGSGDSNRLEGWLSQCGLLKDKQSVTNYDFLCSEASLPGASLDYTQEFGSRQGVTEYFPTKRVYPSFDMTFYVDAGEYKLIRLFEEWLNFINPLYTSPSATTSSGGQVRPDPIGQGNAKNNPDFFKMRYPELYKRIISITKFERDFRQLDSRGRQTSQLKNPSSLTYRMIEAFPYNITAIPVTYEGSVITKTRVSFLYSRYVLERNIGDPTV
jgi:hypothetical protein